MTCVLIQPSHHLLVPFGRIVDGVANPIKFSDMTATLGYGSNQPQQQ
jgi:hypothetical protein